MNKKLIVNILMLVLGIVVCIWSAHLLQSGETEFGRKHPIGSFLLGVVIIVWALKDILLVLFDPLLKNYPKLHKRLNSGFWDFLLGPVKDDK
ncbi:hypothetical protein ACOI22_13760 [Glaciecola sp. 2405UD65-10]|uniref:hypothetical protein n=1 Tax=Glaciecola sp. 2405UD65-10 TaxID=3397244 RepID=UPI003B5A01D3